MSDIYNYQVKGIDFFFDIIKWVFNDFLIRITVLDIPLLYILIALIIASAIITGLLNTSKSSLGSAASSRKRYKHNKSEGD